jgi:DNA-directed RNA polymerase subunit K/omega
MMKDVVLIDKLTNVVPNKYEAIRVIAKEARRINAVLIRGGQGEVDEKPTVMALYRMMDSKVKYQFIDEETHAASFEDDEE